MQKKFIGRRWRFQSPRPTPESRGSSGVPAGPGSPPIHACLDYARWTSTGASPSRRYQRRRRGRFTCPVQPRHTRAGNTAGRTIYTIRMLAQSIVNAHASWMDPESKRRWWRGRLSPVAGPPTVGGRLRRDVETSKDRAVQMSSRLAVGEFSPLHGETPRRHFAATRWRRDGGPDARGGGDRAGDRAGLSDHVPGLLGARVPTRCPSPTSVTGAFRLPGSGRHVTHSTHLTHT
jgi:hypothetical protein